MNHKYEQRTICPNGEIRTRTIDANELVDLLLQMHFLKQSGEQLMLESNANDENGWAWNLYSRLTSGTIVIICRLMCCFIRRTAVLLSPVPALLTRRLSVSSRLSCEIWIKEHLSFTFVWYTKLSVP